MRAWWSGPMLLLLASPAAAQTARSPADRSLQPRAQPLVWRAPPGPLAGGRLGLPIAGNLQLGVGRFAGPELTRPRTHTEPIGRTTEIGRRQRGMAAVGLSLRF